MGLRQASSPVHLLSMSWLQFPGCCETRAQLLQDLLQVTACKACTTAFQGPGQTTAPGPGWGLRLPGIPHIPISRLLHCTCLEAQLLTLLPISCYLLEEQKNY